MSFNSLDLELAEILAAGILSAAEPEVAVGDIDIELQAGCMAGELT